MSWNAEKAILRSPREFEHTGVAPEEAVRHIVGLNREAQISGVTKNVAEHLAHLAPLLVMLPLGSDAQ